MNEKNVLLFSPILDGHRQVYLQYFVESLLKRYGHIFLVSDSSEINKNYPYLKNYQNYSKITIVEIENGNEITLREFRSLQDRLKIDLTVILEADNHLKLINFQILPGFPRLRGKNIGVFLRSGYYIYSPKPASRLWDTILYIKHLPKGWHSIPSVFHEFLLPGFKLIDLVLMLDENFITSHPKNHLWLPDIFMPLNSDDLDLARGEQNVWEPRLAGFIEKNKDRDILLYFGGAQRRRGYDTLLKLACDENCCFIHCGLSNYLDKYIYNVTDLKNQLSSMGMLFETNAYIQSYQVMELFFKSCNYVVLPYRDHFGSSGVMLQSIHFGKPVLVPDRGLMSIRTQKNHLGLTYKYEDYEDLRKQFSLLKKTSNIYLDDLVQYKESFSYQKVMTTLDNAFDKIMS